MMLRGGGVPRAQKLCKVTQVCCGKSRWGFCCGQEASAQVEGGGDDAAGRGNCVKSLGSAVSVKSLRSAQCKVTQDCS